MSDMPERIWASGGHVPEWDTHIGTFVSAADSDATEYVRHDKVQALADLLTEACSDLAEYVDAEYPPRTRRAWPDTDRRHHRDMDLCRRIDAALAAFTPLEPPPE